MLSKPKELGTKKHIHWSEKERQYYEANRKAIDRETEFSLAKKLYSLGNDGYASAGDLLSDELYRCTIKHLGGINPSNK